MHRREFVRGAVAVGFTVVAPGLSGCGRNGAGTRIPAISLSGGEIERLNTNLEPAAQA